MLEIGKTYQIEYYVAEETDSYHGPAKLLEMEVDEDEEGNALHHFELMDDSLGCKAYFSDSDIVKEAV